MPIKELVSEFEDPSNNPRRRKLATTISEYLVKKIISIQRNWPQANCGSLLAISHGIKSNPKYLDGLLSSPDFQLLLRSRQIIALERTPQEDPARIASIGGMACSVTAGDGKFLLENLEVGRFRYQVWDSFEENAEYIGKHLGKPNRHSSVWNDDIDREQTQLQAILHGRGKFRNTNRIDFVQETDQLTGYLKKTSENTGYVYVELVRHPLHTKKRKCTYHGFPISYDEFRNF